MFMGKKMHEHEISSHNSLFDSLNCDKIEKIMEGAVTSER